jgi:cell division transport system permease protein
MRLLSFVKRNIRRTPYQAMAAIMVMFLTFLTMLIFILLAMGSHKLIKEFESKPQVIGFFEDGATEQDVMAIKKNLEQTGKVASVKYITKEEAFQNYKDLNKADPKSLELVTSSMLPPSLEVSTNNPQDLALVADMLAQEPVIGKDNVIIPVDVIDAISKFSNTVRTTGIIVISFLSLFSLLIILMIIGFKIRIKRREIEIMKLLGATSWFIRAPFILEGIFYSSFGAFVAWVMSYLILWYATPWIQEAIKDVSLLPISPIVMLELLLIGQLIAVVIGFVGSYGAIRRYLHL